MNADTAADEEREVNRKPEVIVKGGSANVIVDDSVPLEILCDSEGRTSRDDQDERVIGRDKISNVLRRSEM
jgi:hypothetical protein